MKKSDDFKEKIEEALISCEIPEHERNAIVAKIEEAVSLDLLTESDKNKIIEIKNDLINAKSKTQIISIVVKLVEFLIAICEIFF